MTPTDCKIGDTGAASLSDALKTNTTLKKLDLNGEEKKETTHKWDPSTIHSFPFSLNQKSMILETQGQHHWVKY